MKTLFLLTLLISTSLLAMDQPRKATVYHLAQHHGSLDDVMERFRAELEGEDDCAVFDVDHFIEGFRPIFYSQKQIYVWLKTKLASAPNTLVLCEHVEEVPSEQQNAITAKRFSSFLLERPNFVQMISLALDRPARVLHALGKLPNLGVGENKELFEHAIRSGGVLNQKAAFDDREIWLAQQVQEARKNGFEGDIVIILGAAHDLAKYFTAGPECIVDNVNFSRSEMMPRKDVTDKNSELYFEPVLDFAFRKTGKYCSPEFDKVSRASIQLNLMTFYLHTKGLADWLKENALNGLGDPMCHFQYACYTKISEENLRETYEHAQFLEALKHSTNLDEFMTYMAPIYNPSYAWDRTLQSIEKR